MKIKYKSKTHSMIKDVSLGTVFLHYNDIYMKCDHQRHEESPGVCWAIHLATGKNIFFDKSTLVKTYPDAYLEGLD